MMNNCMISIMPNADTLSASSTAIRQKLKIYTQSTKIKFIIPYSNRLYQTSELMLVYLSIFQLQISQHATGLKSHSNCHRMTSKEFADRRNSRKMIITFLPQQHSLRIISQFTLIPFHGFSQTKITPILLYTNSAFLVMALYLKTKSQNSR